MRLSAFLGYLSSRYLEVGDRDIDLIIEDAVTHDKILYKIKGIEISNHKSDPNKSALQILARITRTVRK